MAFHGVSGSLHNILSWLKLTHSSYKLFDNDERKIGREFYGHIVAKPSRESIKDIDQLVILPYAFFSPIKDQWLKLDFKGEIINFV